jgi:hypothetical protein
MSCSRIIPGLAVCTMAVMLASPAARAQLGSVNNPPPQHLFNLGQPPRLNDGLGTMAERRARLAQMRRAQQHRTHK